MIKLPEARENAGDKFASVSSFASDWLEGWREFSTPITKRGRANPTHFQITSDGQIKVAQNFSTYLSTNEDRYLSATRLIHF